MKKTLHGFEVSHMKQTLICMLLLLIGFSFSSCANKEIADSYSDKGYDVGYQDGYADGVEGETDNYDDGYETGYSDGQNDGYYMGATYTCLFFGDVDKAFQSASNGGAWHTFVDAYNQYVSKIYDNDDTRLEIIWALIGLSSGNGISENETDLLISTFGEDLFIRNGSI